MECYGYLKSGVCFVSGHSFVVEKMASFSLKFIHQNLLRAAELRIGPDVMFSEGLVKSVEEWCQVLRMDAVSCSLALINIVATTLEISWVFRGVGDAERMPLNLYMMILARSCTYDCFETL